MLFSEGHVSKGFIQAPRLVGTKSRMNQEFVQVTHHRERWPYLLRQLRTPGADRGDGALGRLGLAGESQRHGRRSAGNRAIGAVSLSDLMRPSVVSW